MDFQEITAIALIAALALSALWLCVELLCASAERVRK